MSAKIADIVNDSEGTQSESDDPDFGKGDLMKPSNELGQNLGSEGEESDLGEDRPRKSSKTRYTRKKADQPRINDKNFGLIANRVST